MVEKALDQPKITPCLCGGAKWGWSSAASPRLSTARYVDTAHGFIEAGEDLTDLTTAGELHSLGVLKLAAGRCSWHTERFLGWMYSENLHLVFLKELSPGMERPLGCPELLCLWQSLSAKGRKNRGKREGKRKQTQGEMDNVLLFFSFLLRRMILNAESYYQGHTAR